MFWTPYVTFAEDYRTHIWQGKYFEIMEMCFGSSKWYYTMVELKVIALALHEVDQNFPKVGVELNWINNWKK